jgi:hypothetical protein
VFGGSVLPAEGGGEAIPVRLLILKWEEGGGAQASLGVVVG